MGKEYKQLGIEERSIIAAELEQGSSRRAIARLLDRPHCTILRELNRNAGVGRYGPQEAQARCAGRKAHPAKKLEADTPLWQEVQALMSKNWSPEQIAGKLKRMYPAIPASTPATKPSMRTFMHIPEGSSARNSSSSCASRTKPANPAPAAKTGADSCRTSPPLPSVRRMLKRASFPVIGRRLIKGKYNRSSVGTLVERTSRYVILVQLDNATAPVVHQGFVREMKPVPELLRKSLTYDRGKEMALHKQIAADLNLTVYFADPHAPWQRGCNENTNGLVREYLPKGTDLSIIRRPNSTPSPKTSIQDPVKNSAS